MNPIIEVLDGGVGILELRCSVCGRGLAYASMSSRYWIDAERYVHERAHETDPHYFAGNRPVQGQLFEEVTTT